MSDVSLSVSEAAFKAVFNKVTPTPSLPFDGSTSLGPVWIGVEAAIHIEGAGDIDFEDSNTFLVKELEIAWDKLIVRLGFDIKPVEIGKFCVFRVPEDSPFLGGECLWEFPGCTLFTDEPDIGPLKINLNAIITYIVTEVSGRFQISLVKEGDKLKLKADVQALDVDPISISDTFGKLPAIMQAAIAAGAAGWVATNPGAWLLDVALGILGLPSLTEVLLDLMDIEDDIQEWLMDKLNFSIGVPNLIYQAILDKILSKTLFEIPDPYEFLPTFDVDIVDYGGYADPQPAGPKTKLEAPRAAILNPSAAFDADNLNIHFDLGV